MQRLIRSGVLAVCVLVFAFAVQAQDVVGGIITSRENFGQIGGYTIINLDTPFNTAGQIARASAQFDYFGGGTACSASDTFKIRVYRPYTGSGYALVAERGPFNDAKGTVTVGLSPAITVKRGDLLGITLFGPGPCGVTGAYGSGHHMVQMNGDFAGGTPSYFVDAPGNTMNVRASSLVNAFMGTLPGVGVTAGAAGSSFNTSLSITNPTVDPMTVTFQYHAVGAGPDVPPTVAVLTLPPNNSRSPQLTELMSVSGVGSLDVFSTGATPLVSARVYNQAGSGTNGFTEPLVAPTHVAHEYDYLWMTMPGDSLRFRMNIGVRTLASGASMYCVALNAGGTPVANVTKTYAASATSLESLQAFFNDPNAVTAGGSVQCIMTQSAAVPSDVILYSTITDNQTNDSAMFLAERR